jgi:hypothetical protein
LLTGERISCYVKCNTGYITLSRGRSELDWLLLVSTLPGQNGALRIRTWRALKALGAGSLRDGAYVLPARPDLAEALAAQQRDIIESGGTAYLLRIGGEPRDDAALRSLFDRGEEYATLIAAAEQLASEIARRNESEARRGLRQLARDYASLEATDYFGSAGHEAAKSALQFAERTIVKVFSPGEPVPIEAPIPRLDPEPFRKRLWATRRHLWVDRVASAWLIARFIDPAASFRWLDNPSESPAGAVTFDFDGATFSHVNDLTTFEVLVASFGLEHDSALARIGMMVHALDVGGNSVPEAAGFEALLAGTRERCRDDDELLAKMRDVLDSFYKAFSESPQAQADTGVVTC